MTDASVGLVQADAWVRGEALARSGMPESRKRAPARSRSRGRIRPGAAPRTERSRWPQKRQSGSPADRAETTALSPRACAAASLTRGLITCAHGLRWVRAVRGGY